MLKQVDSRDNLLDDLNQTILREKLLREKRENKIRELSGIIDDSALEKERMLHANGALQDSLAVLETKIIEANVIKYNQKKIILSLLNFLLSFDLQLFFISKFSINFIT